MLDSELIDDFLRGNKITTSSYTNSFFLSEEKMCRTLYTRQYIFIASILIINKYCSQLTFKDKYLELFNRNLLDKLGYMQTSVSLRNSIVYRKYELENHNVESGDVFSLRREWWRQAKLPAKHSKTLIIVDNNWHVIRDMSSSRKTVTIDFIGGKKEYSVNDIVTWAIPVSTQKKEEPTFNSESSPNSESVLDQEKEIIDVEPRGILAPPDDPQVEYSQLLDKMKQLELSICDAERRIENLEFAENRLDTKVRFLLFIHRPD